MVYGVEKVMKQRHSSFISDTQSENDILKSKIREVEDENQELRAQILTQKKTISGMRNELSALRHELSDVTRTSNVLTDRIRQLSQNPNGLPGGLLSSPLQMTSPPPIPPPLPPPRIRISPRQVGAGEALTTPLGVSVSSSPPRHRVKRENRQNFRRPSRSPIRRSEDPEPGPSSDKSYIFGLSVIPQFQDSFLDRKNNNNSSSMYVSSSDSSDSEKEFMTKTTNNIKLFPTSKDPIDVTKQKRFSKGYQTFNNTRSAFNNGNLTIPNTDGRFFFSVPFLRESDKNSPSTSIDGKINLSPECSDNNTVRFGNKISDCTQYTFPNLHEGLHQQRNSQSVVTTIRQSPKPPKQTSRFFQFEAAARSREFQSFERSEQRSKDKEKTKSNEGALVDAKSALSSSSEDDVKRLQPFENAADTELDGFQTDESSNVTSDVFSISESDGEKM